MKKVVRGCEACLPVSTCSVKQECPISKLAGKIVEVTITEGGSYYQIEGIEGSFGSGFFRDPTALESLAACVD